ncbi:MAG: DUF1444 family protein [Pseudomonadota bacterium]
MNFPWWSWILLAVSGIIYILSRAAKSYRKMIRQELIDFFKEHEPELTIDVQGERELLIRDNATGDESTLFLHNLLQQVSTIKEDNKEERKKQYEILLNTYKEKNIDIELDPEQVVERLRPRLLQEADLDNIVSQNKTKIPSISFGISGLYAVLVIDRENSVAYVDDESLTKMGLTKEEAFEIAKDNLRKTIPEESIHQMISNDTINVVKTMDTYDASRILILPSFLKPEESIVALIPDRDTLTLAPVPSDGDWSPLKKLAKNRAVVPLWLNPIVVQTSGFTNIE